MPDTSPRVSHQLPLPIEFAPDILREHGYRDANSYPLVSHGKGFGSFISFRVSPWLAWQFESVELNPANARSVLVLDMDGDDARARLFDVVDSEKLLPSYNWIARRQSSGGLHVAWCLGRSVHRGAHARRRPLNMLARVAEYFADTLQADRGFTGVLSHNPARLAGEPGWDVEFRYEQPFSLQELNECVPRYWRRPAKPVTAEGRYMTVFNACLKWAGSYRNLGQPVLPYARSLNVFPLAMGGPLPDNEIQHAARTAERFRVKWIAEGTVWQPDLEGLSARQSARGRRSGASRRSRTVGRDMEIVARVQAGEAMRAVGRDVGLSANAVWKIVHRVLAEP